MGGLLVALDEPTLGLHPSGQPGMTAVLDELGTGATPCGGGGDPDMVRRPTTWWRSDRVLDPTAASSCRASPWRRSAQEPLEPHGPRRDPSGELRLVGATLHNLRGADLTVHLGRCG